MSKIEKIASPIAHVETSGWCILRMPGGRTLAVASALTDAGFDAWAPRKTFRREQRRRRQDLNGPARTIEIDAPILPTFVFARADRLVELAALAADPLSRLPGFSIFLHAGRVPIIGDKAIEGLRGEETAAAEILRLERDAESRAEARRQRAAAMRTERERRRALRSERREFAPCQRVGIDEAPAFAGMAGVVVSSDGYSAVVAFGGSLTISIEAWRLSPLAV